MAEAPGVFTAWKLALIVLAGAAVIAVPAGIVAGIMFPRPAVEPYQVPALQFAEEQFTAQLDALGVEVVYGPKTRVLSDNGKGVVTVHLDARPSDKRILPYRVDVTLERAPWFVTDVTPRTRG